MADFARPYLDAACWIHALQGSKQGVEVLQPILAAVDAGLLTIVVSAMMPLELLGGPTAARSRSDEERALAALQGPRVLEVPVNRSLVLLARQLRLEHRLASMDAVHLASAVRGRADAFLTYDSRLLAVGRHGDVPIQQPSWGGPVPLPFEDTGS